MANEPPSRRKRATFESLDRISNLPKEVTDEILHWLPIRDAVKTSLLSSGWRYRWSSMPHLVFDKSSIPSLIGVQINLVNFVTRALFLHNDRISKFKLTHFLQTSRCDIDQWILVLSRKDLQHLTLRFNLCDVYELPASLFSCLSLEKLELESCIFKIPSKFQGFNYLTLLGLAFVDLTNETFESLVFRLPLLQVISIQLCKPLSRINICAPYLKSLNILGCFESINFQTTQDVKSASIHVWQPRSTARCKLDEVLRLFIAVQKLEIYQPFLEISPMGHVLERLEIDYYHLKHVSLCVNFEDSKQVLATLCLCRSAPHLKTLNIFAVWNRGAALLYEDHFWETRLRKEDDILHHLGTVILDAFKGVNHDMGFTQFIMMNALVLESLSINWVKNAPVDERLRAVEKMMQCPRASTKAKVVFNAKA